MKIVQRGMKVLVAILAVLLMGSLAIIVLRAAISKTPKNIDINPIYTFKVEDAFTDIEELARKFAVEVRCDKWEPDAIYILAPLPKVRSEDDSRNVFRDVNIFQFGTKQGAQKAYTDHRQIFTEQGYRKLYKEAGTENDKYFMSYEPAHFDYNHGIPCGIVTSPKITVVFLKNNLLILVSYTGYRYYDNYVKEMNEDIAYVGELLKSVRHQS